MKVLDTGAGWVAAALMGAAALCPAVSSAAMVSYYLDQTNVDQGSLVDGINYAIVSIDDNTAGKITFTITPLSPLTSIAGTNFGLQTFDFNVSGTNPLHDSPSPEWTLPANWTANVAPPPNQADGFGRFDAEVGDGGTSRANPLVFQIDSSTGLTINSFPELSSGSAAQGNVYFAAHISGFTDASGATSGYFGGSSLVPVPAAAWLLLSGLAGLGVTMRRTRDHLPA